ncbi:MAG: hypothetical protein IJ600_12855 [Lachnospiraceae bacterium]|nr:hypothetical protein [Lachnospiraceae bacterium]
MKGEQTDTDMEHKKSRKGQYGYLPAQMRREFFKTVLLFGIAFGILILGMVITKHRQPELSWGQSRNNLLTVAAMLGLLPACRSLISAIMFVKAQKHTCPESIYRQAREILPEEKAYPLLAADLYFTAYEHSYPVYLLAAAENEVFGLLAGAEAKGIAGAEAHLKEALQKDGKKNVTVKLYGEEKKFLERLKGAAQAADAQEKKEAKAAKLLEVMYQIAL